jgi:hypothetical protein
VRTIKERKIGLRFIVNVHGLPGLSRVEWGEIIQVRIIRIKTNFMIFLIFLTQRRGDAEGDFWEAWLGFFNAEAQRRRGLWGAWLGFLEPQRAQRHRGFFGGQCSVFWNRQGAKNAKGSPDFHEVSCVSWFGFV